MGSVVLPNHRTGSCGRCVWNGERLACAACASTIRGEARVLYAHARGGACGVRYRWAHRRARRARRACLQASTEVTSESRAETATARLAVSRSSGSGEWARLADSLDSKDKLRSWVESKYKHVSLREKDAGAKLEALHKEYVHAGVHTNPLGKDNVRCDAPWRVPGNRALLGSTRPKQAQEHVGRCGRALLTAIKGLVNGSLVRGTAREMVTMPFLSRYTRTDCSSLPVKRLELAAVELG